MKKMDLRDSLMMVISIFALCLIKPLSAESVSQSKSSPPMREMTHNHWSSFTGQGSWFASVGAGLTKPSIPAGFWINNGSDFDPPFNMDVYSAKWSDPYIVSAMLGRMWQRPSLFIPGYALGLRYQHFFAKDITGLVMQYSLPEFINYEYNLGVRINTLSVYTKLDLVKLGRVLPYLTGGIGLSSNHSEIYEEKPLPGIVPRDNPSFAARTKSQFTYDLGLGVDVVINPQVILSLGYAYQYFGKFNTGYGQRAEWTSQRLDLGKLTANTVRLELTYLFDKKEKNEFIK
ncbi:hypothetical protein Lmor_1253 [Legionella moravica]|uniref:Opacity protein and related surface antigens n=1 Tax=Legionella moravica TaxID=39962 RepID=A0A378JTI3_9GAMM|nr:outer membrane beta-barrel protein [Legionella moravica]KTD34720.1 hypothetical protein Lmor_1253 [Legionella moravica]STX61327.1 Opacity protein and related surface antigens [Legionella moravica]